MIEATHSVRPPTMVVELSGDVDLRNAHALGQVLCRTISFSDGDLLVDLSNVDFIDWCGLLMMVRVHRHATARDGIVRWRAMKRGPLRLATATGLDQLLHFE